MRHYATLFDSRYAPQGIALYESLVKHSSEPFTLYVLPLDDKCEDILASLKLPSLIVLSLHAFEQDQRLVEIRQQRTHQEYAWTCASQLCEWLLMCVDCELPELTYLDADVAFFSDPAPVFAEIGDRSIAITPHRFIPEKQYLEATSGTYNVGWITFRNTQPGLECLRMWAQQVRNKCSAGVGCGDQQYLDRFIERFGHREVCVIQNAGVNLGPWGLAAHEVTERDGAVHVGNGRLVCYHFHETRWSDDGTVRLTDYALRPEDVRIIYLPYVDAVDAARERIGALQSRMKQYVYYPA